MADQQPAEHHKQWKQPHFLCTNRWVHWSELRKTESGFFENGGFGKIADCCGILLETHQGQVNENQEVELCRHGLGQRLRHGNWVNQWSKQKQCFKVKWEVEEQKGKPKHIQQLESVVTNFVIIAAPIEPYLPQRPVTPQLYEGGLLRKAALFPENQHYSIADWTDGLSPGLKLIPAFPDLHRPDIDHFCVHRLPSVPSSNQITNFLVVNSGILPQDFWGIRTDGADYDDLD